MTLFKIGGQIIDYCHARRSQLWTSIWSIKKSAVAVEQYIKDLFWFGDGQASVYFYSLQKKNKMRPYKS